MLTILMLRNGENHIVSFRRPNGNYNTICGKMIVKSPQINTISADNTFTGLCPNCKKDSDSMYSDDLNDFTIMARNNSTFHLSRRLEYNRDGIQGPDVTYYDIEDRNWYKFNKYKKLIPKAKKTGKNKKYKPRKYK